MQDMGQKELQKLREALERKIDREQRKPLPKAFQEYSKRLLKDLEARSTVRTAVENLNLAIHGDEADVLSAECIRTFPTVTFLAPVLLRREEIETQKVKGASCIVAVHHARGEGLRTWTTAPFDLMYGFRLISYCHHMKCCVTGCLNACCRPSKELQILPPVGPQWENNASGNFTLQEKAQI